MSISRNERACDSCWFPATWLDPVIMIFGGALLGILDVVSYKSEVRVRVREERTWKRRRKTTPL